MNKIKLKNSINISSNIPNLKIISKIKEESYNNEDLDNTFIVFKSIDNLLYLVYSTKNNSIICYNLYIEQIIAEIKEHHKKCIINLKHYKDMFNKRDLIMTISRKDNMIRVWNFVNWDCLCKITIKYFGHIYTASFINDKENLYIISNINTNSPNSIGILDFNGNIIKEINGSTEIICFIDIYFDQKFSKKYILFGKLGFAESYDYNKNKIYHRYIENKEENFKAHCSLIIHVYKNKIILIDSSRDGNIRIWDFHLGILIKKIYLGDIWLYGICLWDNDYLFVGCEDKTIKLIDLKKGNIIKSLSGYNNSILTVNKIFIPKYGNCLITQEKGNAQIIIWKNYD